MSSTIAQGLHIWKTEQAQRSGHGGLLGCEYGRQGQPEAFAAKLREVLEANA